MFFIYPAVHFKARIVATTTTASGALERLGVLISKNFSAPRSAPNPASVTVYSPKWRAVSVAMTLLQPWAMLAKGPHESTQAFLRWFEPNLVSRHLSTIKLMPLNLQILDVDRLFIIRITNQNIAQSLFQIIQIRC